MTDHEREIAKRAKRAHERRHGQSTWIEAHYYSHTKNARVTDHELGIVTYWQWTGTRVRFSKQIGERL